MTVIQEAIVALVARASADSADKLDEATTIASGKHQAPSGKLET